MPQYWLMKSEPDVYGIDDLERDGQAEWDGVRNYQARNFMRDDMIVGDWVLYYHSNTKPPGVVGLAKVVREGYPDFTAWDEAGDPFDPQSTPDTPRWYMVDIEHVETFPRKITLQELREAPELDGMLVTKRGQRLSVQPVAPAHFRHVLAMADAKTRL